jgi:hypothetical protein
MATSGEVAAAKESRQKIPGQKFPRYSFTGCEGRREVCLPKQISPPMLGPMRSAFENAITTPTPRLDVKNVTAEQVHVLRKSRVAGFSP